MTDDPILAKIRKLLAKAEDDACTPAEAELFTAKAAELIAKYGIDQARLAEQDPTTDQVGDRVLVLDAPYALDKASLLHTVATALRCKTVQRTRYMGGVKQISLHLFGYGADLDRVEVLFTSLLVQAAHALAVERVPAREHPAAYRRSWYAGYAVAIGRRLRDAESRATAAADQATPAPGSGRSMALVLADRTVQVRAAVTTAYPRLTNGRARQLSGSGAGNGYAAGQRADLGSSRLRGSASTRAIGGR
jgi:hypothetical protein